MYSLHKSQWTLDVVSMLIYCSLCLVHDGNTLCVLERLITWFLMWWFSAERSGMPSPGQLKRVGSAESLLSQSNNQTNALHESMYHHPTPRHIATQGLKGLQLPVYWFFCGS